MYHGYFFTSSFFRRKLEILLIFILLTNLEISAQNVQYCNAAIYGRYAENGTLCLYSPITPGPGCGDPRIVIPNNGLVTTTAQNYIVQRHNTLRSMVASGQVSGQPTAAVMNRISWSPELALAAQAWANQCRFRSDVNRNETTSVIRSGLTNPVYVGQNVFAFVVRAYTNTIDEQDYWDMAIDRWYNEVNSFNNSASIVNSYSYQPVAGHYTQIVAGITTLIGCGFRMWGMSNGRTGRIHVCNYGPGGNIPGQPIYVAGPPCWPPGSVGTAVPNPGCVSCSPDSLCN